MGRYSAAHLRDAYETFSRVSDECAASADYNAFADLFTEDCTYIEHGFGEFQGREAVRQWIVPLMQEHPANQMTYSHDWAVIDDENGRVIFCGRTHMPDLGDGRDYSATNWTRIDDAGDGRWSREEDIYNPARFASLVSEWQSAKEDLGK
jgi:uncharacterized protein (TIGR02246 family)